LDHLTRAVAIAICSFHRGHANSFARRTFGADPPGAGIATKELALVPAITHHAATIYVLACL